LPKDSPNQRTQTTGCILCQHIRTLDIAGRGYKFVERLPEDILQNVMNIIFAEVEKADIDEAETNES
jgi:mRNA interferase MazF